MNAAVERKKYIYIEYLRVISALAVIIIHISGSNWFKIDIGSVNWVVQTFYNLAGRFSVCVFCMISGALLLRTDKEVRVQDIFSRYIRRILICFVAWVVIYAVFYTLVSHEGLQYFISRLFKLPDHLWYLLMLIGLYLAYPVLNLIAKNRSLTRYLILLLVAYGTLSTISGVTGFFDGIAGENFVYLQWKAFLGNLDSMSVAFVPGYLGLFFLGHYIHEYGLGKWHKYIVCLTIPALLLSGLLTVWISVLTQKYVYIFMLENNPLVILASAGIFAFFRGQNSLDAVDNTNSQSTKIIVWIAGNTFGIYLIHFAIRDFLAQCLNFDVSSYPAILSVPINSILIFLISLALTALLKKIPGLKRIIT